AGRGSLLPSGGRLGRRRGTTRRIELRVRRRARGGGLGRRRARRCTFARAGCGEFASRDGAARERHDLRHGELGSDRAALPDDAAVAKRYIDLGPSYGWGYRVDSRPAPYNYFTSYRNVMAAVANADDADQPVIVASWKFLPTADGDPKSGGFGDSAPATTIDVPYRGGFPVRYTYDANTRTYARFDDGVREVE